MTANDQLQRLTVIWCVTYLTIHLIGLPHALTAGIMVCSVVSVLFSDHRNNNGE